MSHHLMAAFMLITGHRNNLSKLLHYSVCNTLLGRIVQSLITLTQDSEDFDFIFVIFR